MAAICSTSMGASVMAKSGNPSAPRTKLVKAQISNCASTTPSTDPRAPTMAPCSKKMRSTWPCVAPIARRMPISRRFCTTDTTSTLAMPSTTTNITTPRMSAVLTLCAFSAVTSPALVACQLSTL